MMIDDRAAALARLGWRPFFQQQLGLDEWEYPVVRVSAQHRNRLQLLGQMGTTVLDLASRMPPLVVGDWLLLNPGGQFERLLERHSLFRRKAAGTKVAEQLIAANVDTLFVVTSLNDDFNLNRIERYLSLANEAGVSPVIVLSKADLCGEPESMIEQVQALDPLLQVEAVNGLDPTQIDKLSPWCGAGDTVALLGSSGVGKSTLVNMLLGRSAQRTGAIREDDDKGRHVTTGRSLHLMSGGGLLLDTPGMRELQISGHEGAVGATFADITALATECRFGDCLHESEPGCAVQQAIARGELELRRLASYRKLTREQQLNNATLAERRDREKRFGKMVKAYQTDKQRRKS